ncbi:hypothetical protein N0V90_007054 [Kalmusia sp. IMI 367209]|nr:hypothetical protein N0V90_007054 [Kalmusia sp. IMI 367209]
MSDYGDDYVEYEDEWDYVEDEYLQADDLAEHAVPSPPPTAYDESAVEEWDRYDYFNDLEYDSDGYFDDLEPQNTEKSQPQIGQKRKRRTTADRSKKKQRLTEDHGEPGMGVADSPVIWRAQADRTFKTKSLPEDTESYALLKDWREKLAEVPSWVQESPSALKPISPASEHIIDEEEDEEQDEQDEEGEEEEEGGAHIDPAALMAALQSRLAAAGGPLSGMDPQQLLQFALRMANDQDAGDDIAGEMAEEMLGQGEEEDDEEAEANLLSWVSQQRDGSKTETAKGESAAPPSPEVARDGRRPPTPPSSQANRSVRDTDDIMTDDNPTAMNVIASKRNHTLEVKQTSRKRKADESTDTAVSSKKRATKSYDAPTTASQAKAAPAKSTRSGRVRP